MQDRSVAIHHGDLELQGIYSLTVLDLPPDVDPLLMRRLSRRIGEPIEGAGLIVHTPRPIDPSEPHTTLEIRGWPDPRLPRNGTHPTEPIKYLKGHRVELFGGTVGPDFPAPKERLWEITVTKPDGHPYTLQFLAWRQRAYLGASRLYAELRWHPGLDADHVRFGGLGQHKRTDLDRLDRAIGLLRRLQRRWGGGRRRLEGKPEWRALMQSIDDYVRKYPSATAENIVERFNLITMKGIDDALDDLDAEETGEGLWERRKAAAIARLERWQARWRNFRNSPDAKQFT